MTHLAHVQEIIDKELLLKLKNHLEGFEATHQSMDFEGNLGEPTKTYHQYDVVLTDTPVGFFNRYGVRHSYIIKTECFKDIQEFITKLTIAEPLDHSLKTVIVLRQVYQKDTWMVVRYAVVKLFEPVESDQRIKDFLMQMLNLK